MITYLNSDGSLDKIDTPRELFNIINIANKQYNEDAFEVVPYLNLYNLLASDKIVFYNFGYKNMSEIVGIPPKHTTQYRYENNIFSINFITRTYINKLKEKETYDDNLIFIRIDADCETFLIEYLNVNIFETPQISSWLRKLTIDRILNEYDTTC